MVDVDDMIKLKEENTKSRKENPEFHKSSDKLSLGLAKLVSPVCIYCSKVRITIGVQDGNKMLVAILKSILIMVTSNRDEAFKVLEDLKQSMIKYDKELNELK